VDLCSCISVFGDVSVLGLVLDGRMHGMVEKTFLTYLKGKVREWETHRVFRTHSHVQLQIRENI